MRRPLKYPAAAAGFLALLAAAAAVALRVWMPPSKLQALALEKLRSSLGREVRISRAGLGLRGAQIDGLEISEAPDFGAGTFLKAESLRLRLRLLPLLHGRIELAQARLAGWDCQIRKHSDGTFNFSSLGGTSNSPNGAPTTTKKTGGTWELAAFAVARLTLENGTIRYQDPAGNRVVAKGIRASASSLRLSGAFPMSLAFAFSGAWAKKPVDGSLDFRGSIDLGQLDPSRLGVELAPLKIVYSGIPVHIEGALSGLDAPQLSAKLSVASLTQEQLAGLLPGLPAWLKLTPLEAAVRAKASGHALRIESLDAKAGAFSAQASGVVSGWDSGTPKANLRLSLKGSLPALEGKELKAVYPSAPEGLKVSAMAIEAAGELRDEATTLNRARLKLGGLDVSVQGSARLAGGKTSVDLTVRTNEFPVAELAAFSPEAAACKPEGKASLNLRVSGTADSPSLSGSATLNGVSFDVPAARFKALDGSIVFNPDTVSADLRGKLAKGELRLRFKAEDYRRSPNVRADGSLSELDLTSWAQRAAGTGSAPPKTSEPQGKPTAKAGLRTSGEFKIGKITHPNFQASGADIGWNLAGVAPDLSKLAGNVKFHVAQGKFDDLKSAAGQSPMLKMILFPIAVLQKATALVKIPLLPSFDRVAFKEITGDYAFKDGVATVKESHLDSSAAYVATTGTADLANDRLNLHVSTKLGSQLGLRLSGPVGFTVKGSLASPSVAPDVAAILKQPIINDALEQGKKLLQGIFH